MKETAKAVLLSLVRGYKRYLSPVLPPSCRYQPTCSEYAAEAIERYPIWRGLGMALWRLLRCHPLVRGGFDPVPLPDSALSRSRQQGVLNMGRAADHN